MAGPLGSVSLVLHAHLPFVRHPEYPDFLEEDWLYEAITETYIPLLRALLRLQRDGIPARVTCSLSPPLLEMLADPLLQERYRARLDQLVDLSGQQAHKQRSEPLGRAWRAQHEDLLEIQALYRSWGGRILPTFAALRDAGYLDLITCCATHGLLPLMATDASRWAQVELAARCFDRHLGQRPEGFWLAECAYAPGVESYLLEAGIRYFFTESVGLLGANPPARLGTSRAALTPGGVAVFARDPTCSQQVWSADVGYPGHRHYREFYRDAGYDLPYDEVRGYLHSDGVRRNVGLKTHRITGKVELHDKLPYDPDAARLQTKLHAYHFVQARQEQIRAIREATGQTPHLVAPYDAELFGHWWAEGPDFIEAMFRCAARQDALEIITPADWLKRGEPMQILQPPPCTWGDASDLRVWISEGNDWIYPYLHRAERTLQRLLQHPRASEPYWARALRQAARELLLAQASDWAFLIHMGTAPHYATHRTVVHIQRFDRICSELEEDRLEEEVLAELERRDNLFEADLDTSLYRDAPPVQGGSLVVESLSHLQL